MPQLACPTNNPDLKILLQNRWKSRLAGPSWALDSKINLGLNMVQPSNPTSSKTLSRLSASWGGAGAQTTETWDYGNQRATRHWSIPAMTRYDKKPVGIGGIIGRPVLNIRYNLLAHCDNVGPLTDSLNICVAAQLKLRGPQSQNLQNKIPSLHQLLRTCSCMPL